GPDRRGARGREQVLPRRRRRDLERRAVEQPRVARAAIVVGDERVAGEEEAEEEGVLRRAERERVRRSLARAAGEEEDRAARLAGGRELLDVQADRPRQCAGTVERDEDGRAKEAGRRSARRSP